MDKVSNLKESICLKIQNSNDVEFLEAIQGLLSGEHYALTKEQSESIENGINNIKNGNTIENTSFLSETRKWLEKM